MSVSITDNTIKQDGVDAITFDAQGIKQGFAPGAYALWGLELSNNATDAANDIDIAVGACRDKSNTYNMSLSSGLTKQIDAAWTAGTNAGGLFSGTVAADTWYHVFLIRKDSDGTIDAGFDTSVSAANRPAGYSSYKWIGAVLTDATPAIIAFKQVNDTFYWDKMVIDYEVSTPPTAATPVPMSSPLGIEAEINLLIAMASSDTTGTYGDVTHPDLTLNLDTTNSGKIEFIRADGTLTSYKKTITLVRTNASSQIQFGLSYSSASITLTLATISWRVERGAI